LHGHSAVAQGPRSVEQINAAFLEQLKSLGPERAIAIETIRRGWEDVYRKQSPESFVPEALAILYPEFADVLRAFDEARTEQVILQAETLARHADPYVRANAAYFHARALVDDRRFEEAEALLMSATASEDSPSDYTPYAAHLWLLRAYTQARNLRFAEAGDSLRELNRLFPTSPESVRFAVRQLSLEIEQRQSGTLEEVSTLMGYVADRLDAADTTERVRERQRQVVALLDELIQQTEQREQQQSQSAGARSALPPSSPPRPAEASQAPEGSGRVGDLHGAPAANPGEMWGRLPPAERERVLQSLRERFPSRYRQLVEQYYRSLAEGAESTP